MRSSISTKLKTNENLIKKKNSKEQRNNINKING